MRDTRRLRILEDRSIELHCFLGVFDKGLSGQVDALLVFIINDETKRSRAGLLKCLLGGRARDQWDALIVGNVELGFRHVGSHEHGVLVPPLSIPVTKRRTRSVELSQDLARRGYAEFRDLLPI